MGNNELEAVLQAADAKRAEYQAELCELLRIPSVSAVAAHADDVRRAGRWVADRFERMGFDCELVETGGHPIVVAERCDVPDAPTALVYGHYDVQPPDPLSEWITPPFEPTERDGNLFARGATDDKGQMLTHVFSAEAWLEAAGRLPVNLKYVIEGEEETGSPHLEEFVREHTDRLAADVVVISDTCQFAPGQPAITYGLRGVTYFELRLSGPKQDLHSGTFGGAVLNPLNALAKLLAAISDEKGRVQLDGFYDDVADWDEETRTPVPAPDAATRLTWTLHRADAGCGGASGRTGRRDDRLGGDQPGVRPDRAHDPASRGGARCDRGRRGRRDRARLRASVPMIDRALLGLIGETGFDALRTAEHSLRTIPSPPPEAIVRPVPTPRTAPERPLSWLWRPTASMTSGMPSAMSPNHRLATVRRPPTISPPRAGAEMR